MQTSVKTMPRRRNKISYDSLVKTHLTVATMLDIVTALYDAERCCEMRGYTHTARSHRDLREALRSKWGPELDAAAATMEAQEKADELARNPDLVFGPVCPGYLPVPADRPDIDDSCPF